MRIWICKNKAGMACLAVGILFLVIGVAQGQDQAVFQKAIRVCLECIGIG